MLEDSIHHFAETLGSKSPTPGGGAAAAYAALFGASLARMVVEFARGRKQNAEHADLFADVMARIDTSLEHLRPMGERDASAFQLVASAYSLPKGTHDEQARRDRAIQEALIGAMTVPEELAHMARDVLHALVRIKGHVGRNLIGDVGTATGLLTAAARGGELLVRSNASYIVDRERADAALARVVTVVEEVHNAERTLDETVESLIDG